jgi:hypothetical protein
VAEVIKRDEPCSLCGMHWFLKCKSCNEERCSWCAFPFPDEEAKRQDDPEVCLMCHLKPKEGA